MASRRSLPGFLRRSLRRDHVEEDEDDDDDEEDLSTGSIRDDEESDSKSSSHHDDPHIRINNNGSNRSVVKETTTTQSIKVNNNSSTTASTRTAAAPDPPKEPSSSAAVVESSEHSQSSNSLIQDVNDNNNNSSIKDNKLSDSWQNIPTPTAPPPPAMAVRQKSYHEQSMDKVLSSPVVNLSQLRKLGWNGIPAVHRATAWKLLLGYLPSNAARRDQTLRKRRLEYADARAQHYYDVDDNARTLQEQETLRQVLVDVPRTAPNVPLFRHERIRRTLTRILYIWAMRHPASSYVQGINDLATPLLTAFLADYFEGADVLDGHVMNHLSEDRLEELEADVYGCLTNLLAGIQDHYTADQPGVQRMVMRLEELVQRMDADLCRHLEETGIQFLQFAFKWMNCLLLREFSLPCVVRLWDTYISETDGFEGFHVYVCAAFLCQYSSQLQEMSFDELFAFMQDMPTADWTDKEIEVLLSQAYVLSTLFGGSDAHLTSTNAAATAAVR